MGLTIAVFANLCVLALLGFVIARFWIEGDRLKAQREMEAEWHNRIRRPEPTSPPPSFSSLPEHENQAGHR